MPESFKVGWYPPQKTGSSHLKIGFTVDELHARTPITMDLAFCPTNRFLNNVNLSNAETSLSTVCYNKPFPYDGK